MTKKHSIHNAACSIQRTRKDVDKRKAHDYDYYYSSRTSTTLFVSTRNINSPNRQTTRATSTRKTTAVRSVCALTTSRHLNSTPCLYDSTSTPKTPRPLSKLSLQKHHACKKRKSHKLLPRTVHVKNRSTPSRRPCGTSSREPRLL